MQELLGNIDAMGRFYAFANKAKAIDMLMVFDRRVMAGENPDTVLRDLDIVRKLVNNKSNDISIFVDNNQNQKQALADAKLAFTRVITSFEGDATVDVSNKFDPAMQEANKEHQNNVTLIELYFANQSVIQQFDKDVKNRFGNPSDAGTE